MTRGDNYGCKCPACKWRIPKPIGDRPPIAGEIREGVVKCQHCNTELHFWARWTIAVEMEKENRVK